jgi:hypothetical protein
MLNAELSAEDIACLDWFTTLRVQISNVLFDDYPQSSASSSIPINAIGNASYPHYRSSELEEVGTHDLLIYEADALLQLGEELFALNMKEEALRYFHAACVFYRVMETMVPSKATSRQHSKLMRAAQRARASGTLYQNFVRENFTGGSCSEVSLHSMHTYAHVYIVYVQVYEVHGSSKLGKGSYGSVYLATHRLTGDTR